MSSQTIKLLSWLVGIVAVILLVWIFHPDEFMGMVTSVGLDGIAVWCALTVAARLIQVETTFTPMKVLGCSIKRSDLFWIGWLRTFSNQIIPLSGVVAYAHTIRNKTNISWNELIALASPQFVLAASALGIVGVTGGLVNLYSGNVAPIILLVVYSGMIGVSLGITYGTAPLFGLLPVALRAKAVKTRLALEKLAETPNLVFKLIIYHIAAIVFRGLRIWLLFELVDASLNWQEVLLVVAIAESTILFQITPGALGIREGAIVGGASLVGISPDIAAGVALIDRLLVIGITTLLIPPVIVVLGTK